MYCVTVLCSVTQSPVSDGPHISMLALHSVHTSTESAQTQALQYYRLA